MRRFGSLLLAIFFLAACDTVELERQEVPVIMGVSPDAYEGQLPLLGSISRLRDDGYSELMVHIPLRADSMELPELFEGQMSHLIQWSEECRSAGIRLHLGFFALKERDLFPSSMTLPRADWFGRLETLVDAVMSAAGEPAPLSFSIGEDFTFEEEEAEAWRELLNKLREKYPDTDFYYSASIDRLHKVGFWDATDKVGVSYPPIPVFGALTWHRDMNKAAGKLADSLSIPVFISRSNLIGEDKVRQFRNRLYLWPSGTEIEGLVVNSIYSRIPLIDETSYYGLATDTLFLEYLQDYRKN